MTGPAGQNDGTQAIRRAAAMLRHIARNPERGVTVRDVSEVMDLSRSTVHRILRCLVEENLVHQSDDAKYYTIGDLTAELGMVAHGRKLAITRYRPLIEAIARETGATTYLMGRSGNESVCLDLIEATSIIRVIPVAIGQRRPLGVGAGATAILASLDEPECRATIDVIEPYLPHFTRMSGERLREAVEETRRNGFAESRGQVVDGVYGLGLAVRNEQRADSYAISIAVHETLATDASIERWKRCFKSRIEAFGAGRPD
jgi:DNA-binding IclR family transcriptional regulator